jgi:G3E family GTPase
MNVANNTMQEDTVKRDFYDAEKKKAINPIVDMEKDVYTPMFMDGSYSGSNTNFSAITEIEVNLHFRTRNSNNWKVNEGNTNLEVSGDTDNWFCTDFYPYKQMLENNIESADTILLNTSDLVGVLYFDNDDVFYQKDNVAKSFLRFSYYDSPDPNTQSLLCTSTVFMDEHALYDKFIDNSRRNIKDYGMVQETEYKKDESGNTIFPKEEVEDFSGNTINHISVITECLKGGHNNNRKKGYNLEDIDTAVMATDKMRVSSRFTIKNKYATDTSSEGFYLYIFREYSENLHPKPIYMKVEFNHAGVGRTIPFIVPMKWTEPTEESNNEVYPVSALTLSGDDLNYLKEGYPLSYVYAQTYIPLYAVYDFKNRQYVYVFDERYIKRDEETNKVKLNMFEIKIKDEKEATAESRAEVRNNNIVRANINVNTLQFNPNI